MPKYCPTIYRTLDIPLLRCISFSVSLAVVEFFLILPSAILLVTKKSRLSLSAYTLPAQTLNRLLAMVTIDSAIGQIIGIINRSSGERGGQDKAMIDINGSVFFKTIVWLVIFNGPI